MSIIIPKTPAEIDIMREGGRIAGSVLMAVCKSVTPGVSLRELDEMAEKLILESGGMPSFKQVAGYSYTTCINLNEGVVHGIPDDTVIQEGDLVKIDLGVLYKGLHTDVAWTVVAGNTTKYNKFLNCGKEALNKAIQECKPGRNVLDISRAIEKTVTSAGYNVTRDLVGHGVGRILHEDPQIPCYVDKSFNFKLFTGLTVAIEVIYMMGDFPIEVMPDKWTICTKDGSMAGLFEHTVLISEKGPEILTKHD